MTGVAILLVIGLVIVGLTDSAFWTWMFSEATSEPDPDQRASWVFVVKFFGPLGALMYYFQRYRQ